MSRFCPSRCLNTSSTAPFHKWQDPDTLNDYLHCMTTSYFPSSRHEPCECPMDPSCRRRFCAGRAWFRSAIKCHSRIDHLFRRETMNGGLYSATKMIINFANQRYLYSYTPGGNGVPRRVIFRVYGFGGMQTAAGRGCCRRHSHQVGTVSTVLNVSMPFL